MKNAKKAPEGYAIRQLFAQNLKHLREQRHVSQLELAGRSGLTHNFINDIENCKKWVSSGTLARLSVALGVQPAQFFLPELPASEREGVMKVYRESLTDQLNTVVSDWIATYMPDKGKKAEASEDKTRKKR
ncbi:MAG: helix-turn-helix domain-containing protein [Treponema sp.]|jgi:transcriptional regulator with XRE-family HTH domain|nr:helix-turn-helix domain-containing protein [Treponema sp.]